MKECQNSNEKREKPWNICDICGKFIPYDDFADESAARKMVTPDSLTTPEDFETLCKKCNQKQLQN